jgi:hypothetical protein
MTFDASEPASFSTAVEVWSEVMDSHGEALEAKICVAHNATFAPDEEELLGECLAWCADNFVEFVRATDAELYVVGHCYLVALASFNSLHLFIHSYIHSSIHPLIHSFIHLFVLASIHSCIHAFMHSTIHPSMHPFIHPLIKFIDKQFIPSSFIRQRQLLV